MLLKSVTCSSDKYKLLQMSISNVKRKLASKRPVTF